MRQGSSVKDTSSKAARKETTVLFIPCSFCRQEGMTEEPVGELTIEQWLS